MRPLLIVLGVVALGLILAVVQPRKDLTPSPSDKAEQERQASQRRDEQKAHKQRVAEGRPTGQANTPKGPMIETVMTIKGKGDIAIELYQGSAPKTVARIVELIKKGFYDGTAFHRVVSQPDVIQTGDPNSKGLTAQEFADRDDKQGSTTGLGQGGSGQKIPFENTGLSHTAGTIAMARGTDLNSADSQIFINRSANTGLDGDYCVFGAVTKGMDVVAKVVRGDVIERFAVVTPATPPGGTQAK